MIILDTNVLSALMRSVPDQAVESWLNQQPHLSIWITSITVVEIRFGLSTMTTGRRRSRLNEAFERMINETLDQRIAPFDEVSAQMSAALMATRQQHGRTRDLRDAMIAGIALAHRATLATGNSRHYIDLSIPVVNPWQPSL
jgi:toxin FitB